MSLIQRKDHILVPTLNFTQTLQYLNDNVRRVFVVFECQTYYFLGTDHVELVYAPLAHLAFRVGIMDLLSLRRLILLLATAILATTKCILAFG